MIMMKCPCKDCFDRRFNCHSMCTRYKDWKKEIAEAAEHRRKETAPISEASVRQYWRNKRYGSTKFKKTAIK